METVAAFIRKPFLDDHPVVTDRILLTSTGTEQTLLAGSVIGTGSTGTGDNVVTTTGLYASGMSPVGILQEDVIVPAEGGAWAVIYVHCACLAEELIWADGTSADKQAAAIQDLRKIGIFARG